MQLALHELYATRTHCYNHGIVPGVSAFNRQRESITAQAR
jgi:hypothetical protein